MNGALWVDLRPWSQRALDESLGDLYLRRAIVVPTAKLAYLAPLLSRLTSVK